LTITLYKKRKSRYSTYLILSVLVNSLLLVKSLKISIMSLIQFPSLGDRNPSTIRLIHNSEKSLDGTSQKRGISDISFNSFSLDELSCLGNFLNSLGGERTVIPSSEFVLEVPSGFSLLISMIFG
jgi:hypothetical protein